jgi:hypothetical protein
VEPIDSVINPELDALIKSVFKDHKLTDVIRCCEICSVQYSLDKCHWSYRTTMNRALYETYCPSCYIGDVLEEEARDRERWKLSEIARVDERCATCPSQVKCITAQLAV